MNPRRALERIDLQPGIIGQDVSFRIPHSAFRISSAGEPVSQFNGLLRCVAGERVRVLNRLRRIRKIAEREILKTFTENGANFPDLMGVPRRDHQSCHALPSVRARRGNTRKIHRRFKERTGRGRSPTSLPGAVGGGLLRGETQSHFCRALDHEPTTNSPLRNAVAAGILPAVEPGILPGGSGWECGIRRRYRALGPGGKMPPSTAARMAAATTGAVQ